MGRKGKSNGKGKGVYCVRGVVVPPLAYNRYTVDENVMQPHRILPGFRIGTGIHNSCWVEHDQIGVESGAHETTLARAKFPSWEAGHTVHGLGEREQPFRARVTAQHPWKGTV